MTNYQKLKECIEVNANCYYCRGTNNYCHTELDIQTKSYDSNVINYDAESEVYTKSFLETVFNDILK